MTLYSVVLFVHVASAFGIAAALGLAAVTLSRLRRANTVGEARLWIEFAPGVPALAIVSLVFMLLSGIYMTAQVGGRTLAWPKVALGALILIGRWAPSREGACAPSRSLAPPVTPNESDIFCKAARSVPGLFNEYAYRACARHFAVDDGDARVAGINGHYCVVHLSWVSLDRFLAA